MILGKITGKLTPSRFKFTVEGRVKQFDYVQVYHKEYEYVLCQVVELVRDSEKMTARCAVIGYRNERGQVKSIRSPFEPESEVLMAEDDFIRSIIKLDDESDGAYIGKLEGRNIEVRLNLRELLTKHVAVLAKSGAGKSYTVGVLLEEIIKKRVPLLIIDPHGEYNSLTQKNDDGNDLRKLALFGLKPRAYKEINEYGDQTINENVKPLQISANLTSDELTHILPGKLSSSQMGLLHSALQGQEKVSFEGILAALAIEENNAKWTLINNLEHLQKLGIFSHAPTEYEAMIRPGSATIINLRGISPDVQEIIVYKIMKDLFELRKKDKLPPFFAVIEEAHNYCPERSFGETKCSKIMRTIASEGRKFGLGLCVVSQRPARVDKSVLSQCTTQIILKVTNPNDLRAVIGSVEGITSESETEIQNLPVGSALITGVVDIPLFVDIRPRETKHGGNAADMIDDESSDLVQKMEDFKESDILPIIKPKMTLKDLQVMQDSEGKYEIVLIPALKISCRSSLKNFSLLVEMVKGGIVTDIEKKNLRKKYLPPLFKLNGQELRVLEQAVRLRRFSKQDLISKTGPNKNFESELNSLRNKELIQYVDNAYEINSKFVFSTLDKLHFPYKVEFQKTAYQQKYESKINKESILKDLKRFTEITDSQECFIVHYVLKQKP